MADSINNKAKEYYDNDDTGGSLNNNLKDFLKQQGAEGNSLNTLWRNYAYGEGGNSLNTRLGKLWGTSGSLISRWKDVLGLTWDELKLFFNARRNDPELLLSGATSFDGSDDYLINNTDATWVGNTYTFSYWIKTSTASSTILELKHNSSGAMINNTFFTSLTSTGKIRSYQANSSGAEVYDHTSTNAVHNGAWHHVALSYDNSTFKIYIDGSLDSTDSGSGTISQVARRLYIGINRNDGDSVFNSAFNGQIANVGIWNRALSASEIESIYWKGQYADLKGTELTNLVSWYNLKETGYGSPVASVPEGSDGSFSYSNGTWTFASNVTYTYDSSFTQGLRYRLTYTIATYTSGSINVSFSTGADQGTERSAVGTYTEENDISANGNWYFSPNSFVGTLTNVTLEEVISPDSTGTNNGSIYGATTLTDAYSASSPFLPRIQDKASDAVANYGEVYGGNAVSFDGASDYISVADSSDLELGTSDFSFSFWMNLDDVSGTQTIFNRRKDGSNSHWIQVKNTGYLDFGTSHGGSSVIRSQINSAIVSANKWYHIVWSVDRDSTTNIYIDGLRQTLDVNTKDDGANTLDYGVTALIGGFNHSSPSSLFDGSMSGFKYFKGTALTQDQVRELYTKPELTLPTGIASSALKLDMPMQEGSGTAILDGSGNQNHGTGSGITWATGQEYGFQHPLVRSNNPMVFDGSNDYVDTGASPRALVGSSSAFTVSAWINAQDDDNDYIVGAMESGAERFYFRVFDVSGTGYIRWGYGSSASSDTDAPISLNQWHHVVWTYDNTNAKVYVDGSLKNTTSLSGQAITNTDNLYIGALNNNGSSVNYWKGFINDVAIWDSALTANEITALYNSGLPLLPTTDSGNYASADDVVGYWRNDGVTTWLDRSTNSNNGTVSGSPASIIVPEGLNEGRDSQGYYLTDTDSISSGIRFKGAESINIGLSESYPFKGGENLPFSVEFWVKTYDTSALNGIIGNSGDCFYIRLLNTGRVEVFLKGSGGGYIKQEVFNVYADGWNHIAVTYDGSGNRDNINIFRNAIEQSNTPSSSGTYTSLATTTNPLKIGNIGNTSPSSFLKGSLDEIKIYDKVLSNTEILKNYNNGKSAHSN